MALPAFRRCSRIVASTACRNSHSRAVSTTESIVPSAGCDGSAHAARAPTRSVDPGLSIPLVARAAAFKDREALAATKAPGVRTTYGDLLEHSHAVALALLHAADVPSLSGQRVGILCDADKSFVFAQWGVWRAGGVTVPLCQTHPIGELQYCVHDAEAHILLTDHAYAAKSAELAAATPGLKVVNIDELVHQGGRHHAGTLPWVHQEDNASIMYTSGTTGKPKGVLTTHENMTAQITDVVSSWHLTQQDHILHFLPLHHVHGVNNKLSCMLWAGGKVEFIPFNPAKVWDRLIHPQDVSLFMAVPTVYVKMIDTYLAAPAAQQQRMSASAARLRLMVSGSAPLPVAVMERWKSITGHTLLERYGMTEFGMGLSNGLEPSRRFPGCVGLPMPSVRVRVVDETTGQDVPPGVDTPGELRVAGNNVFKEYWKRPHATAESFDDKGYFKTGDIAAWSIPEGCYRILGRASVDILKCGGHKLSALEIERALLENPAVAEAIVFGVPDATYGQQVGALIRLTDGHDAATLRKQLVHYCAQHLAPEKRPRLLKIVDDIPKNAMGKVNKKQLTGLVDQLFTPHDRVSY